MRGILEMVVATGLLFGAAACQNAAPPGAEPTEHSAATAAVVEPAPDVAPPSLPSVSPPSPFESAVRYSAQRGGHAIVIVRGDREVLAVGHNGHSVDSAQPIETATASFWGPLAVAAESDGLLDLDEPVRFTIGEFDGVPWKRDIRIRQLLNYTSGLESGVWPLERAAPDDHYRRALGLEAIAAPGTRFQVGPSHLAIFGEVMRRKLGDGRDAVQYLTQRILDPIGLEIDAWRRDAAGNPQLSTGASLNARQWAKFGVFLRDSGSWRGESIVAASDLAACFEASEVQPRFGLTVWLNPTDPDGAGVFYADGLRDLRVAAGTGNQRLLVIPSHDLVVARVGEAHRDWRDREFLALLIEAASSPPPGGTMRSPSPATN